MFTETFEVLIGQYRAQFADFEPKINLAQYFLGFCSLLKKMIVPPVELCDKNERTKLSNHFKTLLQACEIISRYCSVLVLVYEFT